MIRYSRLSDKAQLTILMQRCFGNWSELCWEANLAGRFLVYELDGEIIAMTGLNWDSVYGKMSVDWTATLPEYRHMGYMQQLFNRMINITDEEIICCCWRICDNEKVNLQSLMDMFGFKCVLKDSARFLNGCNCFKNSNTDCIYYKRHSCYCSEDLYVRPKKGE